ncbi:putative transcriptional regulator [Stappia sp. 22II-S9-Z10]|nr:putative transcriptional regulator [Stappia sp. 22II-S9-Z10]
MSDIDARRKLFLGPQIRKLRRSLKLTQAQMAEGLAISASYLTLIERNQRPLTAQLILRLADAYDIDVRSLAPSADGSVLLGLQEVAADPALAGSDLAPQELQEMAEMFPRIADAMVRLHESLTGAREDAQALAESAAAGAPSGVGNNAVEETREALQARDNYFGELEQVAADFAKRANIRLDLPQALTTSLVNHLKTAHNVDTVIMPYDVMHGLLRRFDKHRNRLMLSELLGPTSRTFQVAHLVGQLEAGELIRALSSDPRCTSDSSRGILRLTLGNYLAGAIMFPYDRFLDHAERLRYDVEVLASRFGASFEQTAHRLTTLRRPGAKGVPFFMIRVDRAGNISKRFGGGVFPFARSGGTCPRWRLYEAFRTPGRIVVDLVALPEGQSFVTVGRTTERASVGAHNPGQELVVGLGAETAHAGKLVYADGLDLAPKSLATAASPIGVNCRLCPREQCNWRAFPPLTGKLVVDVTRRSVTPYHFVRD